MSRIFGVKTFLLRPVNVEGKKKDVLVFKWALCIVLMNSECFRMTKIALQSYLLCMHLTLSDLEENTYHHGFENSAPSSSVCKTH